MDYTKSIEAWAAHRGLDKTNPDKQLIKLLEETGELAVRLTTNAGAISRLTA